MRHRMCEYHADRERENEYQRQLTSYKKLGIGLMIGYVTLCGACMLLDKPKDNYQSPTISTNSVVNTNTIDNLLQK